MTAIVSYDPSFTREFQLGYDTTLFSTKQELPPFDLRYWYLQFPRPQMASMVHTDDDTISIKCAWADCDALISLCWDSTDITDHPLGNYDTRTDYTGTTWTFSLAFDENIPTFDSVNGITLTIINASGTHYVRMWNYALPGSTGTSATFALDFSTIQEGFTPAAVVDCSSVSQMFLTFSNTKYSQGVKLAAYEYSTVSMKQISFAGPTLSVNVPVVPQHGTQMTLGYDDLYNLAPKRIVDQIITLGYTTNCTCYIGMSHFMKLGWKSNESRFAYIPDANPINDASYVWLQELYTRLKAANINLIFSMSYEMLYDYIPYDWCQLDYLGNPAQTGWVPPSSLMAFTKTAVMNHLIGTANQCLTICDVNDTKYFQIGEPWWWDGSYSSGRPCFYDPATVALFAAENPGHTMYQFTTVNDPVTNPSAQFTAAWLSAKLGISTNQISNSVKANFTNVKTTILFFTPQAFGGTLTSIVNYPQNQWKYPNFDFFQIECYDEVTQGNIDAQDAHIRAIIPQLGYTFDNLQYFAGFVLYHDAASADWPLIYEGMTDAYDIGITNLAIWSYSQIVRDGLLVIPHTVPATFTITINGTSPQPIVMIYSTKDGTAKAITDYVAKTGTLTFSPGTTSQQVTIQVCDVIGPGPKYFLVELSNPVNTTIVKSTGMCTITNT
jgi:hypothetical protein